ncbi:hypothetical protein J6590_078056 [Homalodisca vitripennis]|nr:hypothetical protein J6590_078056 [Homalodisca vitripennis]
MEPDGTFLEVSCYMTNSHFRSETQTKGLKVTSKPSSMAGHRSIQRPRSSHIRRYLMQMSRDSRHTRYTVSLIKRSGKYARERAASFDFVTPTTENSKIKPQKHLEGEQPSGKTDGSTSCKETAPGPSKDQQYKVANATSSPSTPGEKTKKTQKDKTTTGTAVVSKQLEIALVWISCTLARRSKSVTARIHSD